MLPRHSSSSSSRYPVARRGGVALLALLAGALLAPTSNTNPGLVIIFSGEGCRLNTYDKLAGFNKETVIPGRVDDPAPGGLDLNAQSCHFPDGSGWFIGGEDTGQPNPPAGWGIFQLQGTPGNFFANQIGKLTPTFQPNLISQPENYGCGFLADGRVLTTDVGEQYPPVPGNGQLIVWFPPFDVWSDGTSTDPGTYLGANKIKYCKIDIGIATAGGIYVDASDNIYVASNRPSEDPFTTAGPGGVFVYHAPHPTSNDAAGGCASMDDTGAPLATSINKELFIPANGPAGLLTASAIARAANGRFYVSSVFSGTIVEFDPTSPLFPTAASSRTIVSPPPGESPPYPTNGTPFGLGVDPDDGTIYYADLGIGVGPPPGPEDGEGDVYRVAFNAQNNPLQPVKIDHEPSGLAYPDGIGVLHTAVLIHPSPTIVRVNGTREFSATGIGLGNAVVWSVEEGAAGGSITASGLYTAPAVAPPGGRAHVLAASVDTPSIVGRAPVYVRQNAGSFP